MPSHFLSYIIPKAKLLTYLSKFLFFPPLCGSKIKYKRRISAKIGIINNSIEVNAIVRADAAVYGPMD
jgi:hypothetical protein